MIDRLAEDYQDFKLRAAPTWGHMIGEYAHADRFEDVSRAGEEAVAAEARAFLARAEALDESTLDLHVVPSTDGGPPDRLVGQGALGIREWTRCTCVGHDLPAPRLAQLVEGAEPRGRV